MNNEYHTPENTRKLSTREKQALAILGIALLLIAIFFAVVLVSRKPTAKKRKPQKSAPAVSVISVQPSNHRVEIPVMGIIEPELQISLAPKVSGEIIEVHPEFLPGGVVADGETLLAIDTVDYIAKVAQAEAQLEQAKLDLQLEEGKQIIAEKEWRLIGKDPQATDLEKELILRKPQLRKAKASVNAASAELRKARADLERTRIKAPFNAVIRSRSVNLGDQASPQKTLATLIGTDTFHVLAPVSVDRLTWLEFFSIENPDAGQVFIRTKQGNLRKGRLLKLLSDIEPGGRMAQLLIEIEDPMNLKDQSSDTQPLLIGEYVQIMIAGKIAENVTEIPRVALRDNETVWILSPDNTLEIIPVDVIWRDPDSVLIRGLPPVAQVIISDLSSPVQDMALSLTGAVNGDSDLQKERSIQNSEQRSGRSQS